MIKKELRRLAPKGELSDIWDNKEDSMNDGVLLYLLNIAKFVIDKAKMGDLGIKGIDVTVTGSMANYNYTDDSDIDLHIVYKSEKGEKGDIVEAYLNTLKNAINTFMSDNDIKLGKHPIEIYFQKDNEPHSSTGVYSLIEKEWLSKPEPFEGEIDKAEAKKIALDMYSKISGAQSEKDLNSAKEYIKRVRKSGLETDEKEYSPENLAYKVLRNMGVIDDLYDDIEAKRAKSLTLFN